MLHQLIVFLFLTAMPFPVFAQNSDEDDALYSDGPDAVQSFEGVSGRPGGTRVIFSGSVDFRLVQTGASVSWKKGGRGLTRYGGIDTGNKENQDGLGDQSSVAFKIPQITMTTDILFDEFFSGFIQFNYDDHYDSERKHGRIGVVEAYLGYDRGLENNSRVLSRLGLLIPPISLEHPDPAWNTRYTITPSAINSWVGEELRVIAFEANYRIPFSAFHSLELMLAPFSGNDPAGSILTWRGWALHDYQLTAGSRLKAQSVVPEALVPKGEWVEPFKELDGRMGYYAKMGIRRAENWKMEMFYYDNMGDQVRTELSTREYAWRTKFTNFSMEWFPFEKMTVMSQFLVGSTEMGNRLDPGVAADLNAAYLLLSYSNSGHRISGRYDSFTVTEKDNLLTDPNDAEGTALTVAYLFDFDDAHRIGAEFLTVDSSRPGVEQFDENDDPDDDLFQLMYRMIF
ncbi:MAG: hypothetical protein HQM13_07790 [SAR324 cluster bacterium]|nr:hypothetical protein [SAR324 cluster bacterium]